MSSACTCHIDRKKCLWCKTKIYFSTFGSGNSQGMAIHFPDGRITMLHTKNMTEAHELADLLSETVVNIEELN